MRNEAAAELETRSVFFSSASHDFRQRLHAMKLLAHSAINDAGKSHGSSPPPLKRLADSVEDVEHYITNVLDFARFDRSSPNAERRVVPLQQVFQQLDLNFEDVAAAKRLKNFATVVPQKGRLLLYLHLDVDQIAPPPGIGRDVRQQGHWGTGDMELSLIRTGDLDLVKPLIQQAYEGRAARDSSPSPLPP